MTIVLAAALLLVASMPFDHVYSQQPAAKRVDLGAFVKEIMSLKMEGNRRTLAMWFPYEFYVQSNLVEGDSTREQVEAELAFLKPFHTIIIQRSIEAADGTDEYATQKQVRDCAFLEMGDEKIKPLDRIPPKVSAVIEAMKVMISAEGDAGSANMHVLVFPTKTKSGKPIIDLSQKASLTMHLNADDRFKEEQFVWRTPFDALTSAPPCPKCGDAVSAKWTFCPWCGARLDAN